MREKMFLSIGLTKDYSKLKLKKYRVEKGLFIAEGIKICRELQQSAYEPEVLIINSDEAENSEIIELSKQYQDRKVRILFAKPENFNKIADSKSPQGVIAVVRIKRMKIDEKTPYFIAVENVQDPGNLGTILRTALWFGVKNILLSNDSVDIYSPKTIRSTMGNIFGLNIEYCDNLIEVARRKFPNHKLFGAELNAEKNINQIIIPDKFGLFFGNEANGLNASTVNSLDENYIIPGSGDAESLNLSVSAGIALYHFLINK